jgi:hypothetical protein
MARPGQHGPRGPWEIGTSKAVNLQSAVAMAGSGRGAAGNRGWRPRSFITTLRHPMLDMGAKSWSLW